MSEELVLLEAEEKMEKVLDNYLSNIRKIVAGLANSQILNHLKIVYFETLTPISQLAHISTPEPKQLLIKPFDKSINKEIVAAINLAAMGFQVINEGDKIRVVFPDLTTDRRKEFVKSLGKYTEQSKVLIRSVRQEANKLIKSLVLPKDQEQNQIEEIQKITNKFIEKINSQSRVKEQELMAI